MTYAGHFCAIMAILCLLGTVFKEHSDYAIAAMILSCAAWASYVIGDHLDRED